MPTKTVTIGAPNGLHARPAALFVEAVEASGVEVTVTFDGEEADAGSLLDVISLGAEHGDVVELSGPEGSEATLDKLAEMLEKADA